MIFKLILGLIWLSVSGTGQSQCYEEEINSNVDTINVINSTATTSFINILEDDHPYEIKIAVLKSETPTRFNIALRRGSQTVMVELSDKEEFVDGKINYRLNPQINQINFGGQFELDDKFNFYGGGHVQSNQSFTISHNQEYVLYKINLKDMSIEPILSQFVYLYSPLSAKTSANNRFELSIQPISAGVYLKKKITKNNNFKIGLTAGPAINLADRNDSINQNFLGVVNLRFALNM